LSKFPLFLWVYTFSTFYVLAAPIGDSVDDDSASVRTIRHETLVNDPQRQWDHEEKHGIPHDPENYQVYTDLSLNDPEVRAANIKDANDLRASLIGQVHDLEEKIGEVKKLSALAAVIATLEKEGLLAELDRDGDENWRNAIQERWETVLRAVTLEELAEVAALTNRKSDIQDTVAMVYRTLTYFSDKRQWEHLFWNTPPYDEADQAFRSLVARGPEIPLPPPPPASNPPNSGRLMITEGTSGH
jgi:hypothetical protein